MAMIESEGKECGPCYELDSTSTAMLFPKVAIISLNLSVGAEVL